MGDKILIFTFLFIFAVGFAHAAVIGEGNSQGAIIPAPPSSSDSPGNFSFNETDPRWTGNFTLVAFLANNQTFTGRNIFDQSIRASEGISIVDNFGIGWPDTANSTEIVSLGFGSISYKADLLHAFNGAQVVFNRGIRGPVNVSGSGAGKTVLFVNGNITAENLCYANGTNCANPSINYTQVLYNLTDGEQNEWMIENFYMCSVSGFIGENNWQTSTGGAQQMGYSCLAEPGHNGMIGLDSGTSAQTSLKATYKAALFTSHVISGREFLEFYLKVNNATFLNSTNKVVETINLFGFADTTSLQPVDAIYFGYKTNATIGATNWTINTVCNSVVTSVLTDFPVYNGTWYKLTMTVDPALTNVYFYINETLAGNISTNIPNGVGRETTIMWNANVSTVPGTRQLMHSVDWVRFIKPN